MAHSTGRALLEDGTELLFEMNDTVDLACTSLKRTPEEIDRDWRSDANMGGCNCRPEGREIVPVVLFDALNQSWPSHACLRCMTITGDRNSERLDYGQLDWTKPNWAMAYVDRNPNPPILE